MNILKIETDDGEELLRVQVRDDVEPDQLTIAVLKAIREIKLPRKTRCDAGKPRPTTAEAVERATA